jgi:hypothetical protein
VPAIACAGPLPFTLAFLLVPDPNLALVISLPGRGDRAMYQGPCSRRCRRSRRAHARARAGVLMFVTNIIGLALGRRASAGSTTTCSPGTARRPVRYSLLLVLLVMGIWASVHFMLAARALPADLARREA